MTGSDNGQRKPPAKGPRLPRLPPRSERERERGCFRGEAEPNGETPKQVSTQRRNWFESERAREREYSTFVVGSVGEESMKHAVERECS